MTTRLPSLITASTVCRTSGKPARRALRTARGPGLVEKVAESWPASGATLLRLLEPQRETAVQIAAVRALGQLRGNAAAASLLEPSRWQAYTPQVRDAVLTTFLSEERLVPVLLDSVSRRDVAVSALGASR